MIDLMEWARHRVYMARSQDLWSRSTRTTPRAFEATMDRAERATLCEDWEAVAFFLDAAERML